MKNDAGGGGGARFATTHPNKMRSIRNLLTLNGLPVMGQVMVGKANSLATFSNMMTPVLCV